MALALGWVEDLALKMDVRLVFEKLAVALVLSWVENLAVNMDVLVLMWVLHWVDKLDV